MTETTMIVAVLAALYLLFCIASTLEDINNTLSEGNEEKELLRQSVDDIDYTLRVQNKRLLQIVKIYKSHNKAMNKKEQS